MVQLGVNIDHVASLRQARYRVGAGGSPGVFAEPDPARAAHEAELGGADILTVHLREDRRHIHDDDLARLMLLARVKVNLEMGATDEMVAIAVRHNVPMCTLVPEGRSEVTTEGGLDVAGQPARMKDVVARLKAAKGGMIVSAFIDADARQIQAAKAAGFDACELHTGPYAHAFAHAGGEPALHNAALAVQQRRLEEAGHQVRALAMRFNAGHGLNYVNVGFVARLPGISELHIGHSIVSRAVYTGLRAAVAEMKAAIARR
jgi:pyridoxine 5-phosphate synthase